MIRSILQKLTPVIQVRMMNNYVFNVLVQTHRVFMSEVFLFAAAVFLISVFS